MPAVGASRSPRFSSSEVTLLAGSVALITLAAFESLATTTIMPGVVADLGAERWFSAASGTVLAAQVLTIVVAGPLCDARGPRLVLLAGVGLFAAGLAVCAAASDVAWFVAGRVLQGCGAGCLTVPLYVYVGSVASPTHRPTFFAAFSFAWVLPSIVGPGIAGGMQGLWGWRSVFWLVPGLAVLALAPLAPLLARSRPGPGRLPAGMARTAMAGAAAGAGLIAVQVAGALRGLVMAALAVAGTGALAAALPRLLPRGTLHLSHGVPSLIAARALSMAAQYSASAFVPLYLQRLHGWSATRAGVAVTLGSLSWAAGAALQARVRGGRRSRLPAAGAGALVAGTVLVGDLAVPTWPTWPGLLGWAVACLGIGVAFAALSDLALGMVDRSRHGQVAAHLQVADAAGSAAGLAAESLLVAASGPHAYPAAAATSAAAAVLALVAAARIGPAGSGGRAGRGSCGR